MSIPRSWLRRLAFRGRVPSRWHLAAVVVSMLGGFLALVYAVRFGYSIMGDTDWYVDLANAMLGNPPEQPTSFVRPPGYSALLAVIFLIGGSGNLTLVAYIQCGFLALTAYLAYRLAGTSVPKTALFGVLVAAFVALNPTAVQNAMIILTEPLVMLLTTAFGLALVRAVAEQRGTAFFGRWQTGTVVLGAMLLHVRMDMVGMVLPVLAVSVFSSGWRPTAERLRFGLMGGLAVLVLCVPVSIWESIGRGPTFLSTGGTTDPSHEQFARWATTLPVTEKQWKTIVYDDTANVETLPPRTFANAQEKEHTKELLHRLTTRGTSPELEAEWAELSQARRQGNRLGYYIALPLSRSLQFWFSKSPVGEHSAVTSLVLHAYYGAYGALFALGAIASLVAIALPRSPVFLLAWIAVLRTYSILGAGVLTGHGFYEQRYVRCVQPLVLLVALWTLWQLGCALASKRRT